MKILLLHNEYQHAGGEDIAVASEAQMLEAHGHTVEKLFISNHQIKGALNAVKTAWHLPHSEESKKLVQERIRALRPDVVHVHNFFPLFTPSVYDACAEEKVPVVQSLHNYRLLCVNGLLLRNGRPCEDCIGDTPYLGAIHACYRDSHLASLAVARMLARHRERNTWNTKVSRFIAVTEFAKKKFVSGGIKEEKISVKSNFMEDISKTVIASAPNSERPYAVYLGRLSEEKGIQTLVRAWKIKGLDLKVIGDGPLDSFLRKGAAENVEFLGKRPREEGLRILAGAEFLIIPSECYEGFPMAAVEACCLGIPILSSELGGIGEFVQREKVGITFQAGNAESLAEGIQKMYSQAKESYSEAARAAYEKHFTPEANYRALMKIYKDAGAHVD